MLIAPDNYASQKSESAAYRPGRVDGNGLAVPLSAGWRARSRKHSTGKN
jgi:hypothetical protein